MFKVYFYAIWQCVVVCCLESSFWSRHLRGSESPSENN